MRSNFVIIFSAFLGYIVIFLTLKSYKYNRILNSFLLFIIFISSTLLLIAGTAEVYDISGLRAFYAESNKYVTLFIPSFYIYFTYLIKDKQRFQNKDFLHILFLILTIFERKFLILDSVFDCKLNYSLSQFFAIYALVYLIKIFLLLKNNVWNKKDTLNVVITQNTLIKKWTGILFVVILFFVSGFYIDFLSKLFSESVTIEEEPLKHLWVTALIWIVLFIIILSHPEILYGFNRFQIQFSTINPDSFNKNYWNKKSKIKINNNQDQQLKEKISASIEKYIYELDGILNNNSYFINPDFSIQDLAQVLNIPKSHLAFIFKYHSELSFSDYKKISRIQNSLELINTNYLTSNTLDSLARNVGFSSYNPFFTCFKEVVGKSPHEYISTLKKIKN